MRDIQRPLRVRLARQERGRSAVQGEINQALLHLQLLHHELGDILQASDQGMMAMAGSLADVVGQARNMTRTAMDALQGAPGPQVGCASSQIAADMDRLTAHVGAALQHVQVHDLIQQRLEQADRALSTVSAQLGMLSERLQQPGWDGLLEQSLHERMAPLLAGHVHRQQHANAAAVFGMASPPDSGALIDLFDVPPLSRSG